MDKVVSAFAIVCAFLAFTILWMRVKHLEKTVGYMLVALEKDAEHEYEQRIGTMFNFLTDGLDEDDD